MANHPNRSTYPRYWSKFPRQSFESRRPKKGYTRDARKMAQRIERYYAAGYTSEPYVQLVEETANGYRIIAEWMPSAGGWAGPLQAAGLAPTPGDFV